LLNIVNILVKMLAFTKFIYIFANGKTLMLTNTKTSTYRPVAPLS